MDTAALREMPSSLNDACRKLELAAAEIERLTKLADDLRASLTAGDTLPIEETPLGRDRTIARLRAALTKIAKMEPSEIAPETFPGLVHGSALLFANSQRIARAALRDVTEQIRTENTGSEQAPK